MFLATIFYVISVSYIILTLSVMIFTNNDYDHLLTQTLLFLALGYLKELHVKIDFAKTDGPVIKIK